MVGDQGCCQENGVKKGPWSLEEDHKLTEYINKYGHGKWRNLPKLAGLLRSAKSCRLRWTNYLRPGIKRGTFSAQEDEIILQYREKLGNKWSKIAKHLPGRTENDIKNRWYNRLKKGLRKTMPYKRLSSPLTSSYLARLEVEARIGRNLLKLATDGNVHLGHNLLRSSFQPNEMVATSVASDFVDQEQHQLLSYNCERLDKHFVGEDQFVPCSTKSNAEMLNQGSNNNFLLTESNSGDSILALLSSTDNGSDEAKQKISSPPMLNINTHGTSIPPESYLDLTQFRDMSEEIVESPTSTDFLNIEYDKDYWINMLKLSDNNSGGLENVFKHRQ